MLQSCHISEQIEQLKSTIKPKSKERIQTPKPKIRILKFKFRVLEVES